MQAQSENLSDYLQKTSIIDYDHPEISAVAGRLMQSAESETDLVRITYEFVRDEISHSADIDAQKIIRIASEVLQTKHGICYAKSHLLAALLRRNQVPAGLCYQLLRGDNEASELVLHGLSAVYLSEVQKWVRLDARGNKPGVNAQFSINEEMLAFPVREELGEIDYPMIYVSPDANVLGRLLQCETRKELWADLPRELSNPRPTDE